MDYPTFWERETMSMDKRIERQLQRELEAMNDPMNPFLSLSDEELYLVDMSDVLAIAHEQASIEVAELVGPNSPEYERLCEDEARVHYWFEWASARLDAARILRSEVL